MEQEAFSETGTFSFRAASARHESYLECPPADGIRAYEDAYTKIAEDMGVDLEVAML